jgi:hypothetical protein
MVVVVGGHARKVGKTSVICGVIRALSDWNWTAIKISQHSHTEEISPSSAPDSSRFLAAGAASAFWIRELNDGVRKLLPIIAASENTIIESNTVRRFLDPELTAIVVNGSVPDLKSSALWFLEKADVLVTTSAALPAWPQIPEILLQKKPQFFALPPLYENAALIEEIRLRKNTGAPKDLRSNARS